MTKDNTMDLKVRLGTDAHVVAEARGIRSDETSPRQALAYIEKLEIALREARAELYRRGHGYSPVTDRIDATLSVGEPSQ